MTPFTIVEDIEADIVLRFEAAVDEDGKVEVQRVGIRVSGGAVLPVAWDALSLGTQEDIQTRAELRASLVQIEREEERALKKTI